MKIYTKTGDKGQTSLFGGRRVYKDDLRLESYGTVDELSALIGVAITEIEDKEVVKILTHLQNELFTVGADLATPEDQEHKNRTVMRVKKELVTNLENEIDRLTTELPELRNFILAGGVKGASLLHYARTVCRRAERNVVKLAQETEVGEEVVVYLNRLSDYLFVLARYVNHISQHPETEWQK